MILNWKQLNQIKCIPQSYIFKTLIQYVNIYDMRHPYILIHHGTISTRELLLYLVNEYVDSQSDVIVAGVDDPVLDELRAFG